jgi:hypothetical protein
MADVGPIDILQQSGKEVAYPIVRDMDTFCYERQTAGSMEVGSYAHRPIFMHPDDIPSNEESALSPTELPFTADDFDQQFEEAIDLMDMLGRPRSATRSTVVEPDARRQPRCSARPPRCATCGAPPRCGSRKAPASPRSWPSG